MKTLVEFVEEVKKITGSESAYISPSTNYATVKVLMENPVGGIFKDRVRERTICLWGPNLDPDWQRVNENTVCQLREEFAV